MGGEELKGGKAKWIDFGIVSREELTEVFPEGLPEGGDEEAIETLPELHSNVRPQPSSDSESRLHVIRGQGESLEQRPGIAENDGLGGNTKFIGGLDRNGKMTSANKAAKKLGK